MKLDNVTKNVNIVEMKPLNVLLVKLEETESIQPLNVLVKKDTTMIPTIKIA